MLIANPRAGSASPRTKEVIAKALAADFKIEVEETTARDHATELARDAVDRGFDAVVAFGGDGTINEVMQPLVGSGVALGILPGGSTNVAARSLGIPGDPVEATAFLSERLRSSTRRRVNVGRFGDRFFLFSAGFGLDGEVVKRVEAEPGGKGKNHDWLFIRHAVRAGAGAYRKMDPSISMKVEGHEPERVLLAVCCNARPFTYLKRMPVDVCPSAHLDEGLDIFGLKTIRLPTVPRIAWSLLVSRSHVHWRTATYHHDVSTISLVADEPLPAQVDGDYIGDFGGADLRLVPASLDPIV
jgi:diacylglycerol kinase family enzyme